jgi:hypothetical protein
MNCKDCKHWDAENRSHGMKAEIHKCKRMKMFWDCSDWSEDGNDRIFTDDSLAFVQDGSDYYAELLTKPEFGCAMWEEK